jgi:hypothetical protein
MFAPTSRAVCGNVSATYVVGNIAHKKTASFPVMYEAVSLFRRFVGCSCIVNFFNMFEYRICTELSIKIKYQSCYILKINRLVPRNIRGGLLCSGGFREYVGISVLFYLHSFTEAVFSRIVRRSSIFTALQKIY